MSQLSREWREWTRRSNGTSVDASVTLAAWNLGLGGDSWVPSPLSRLVPRHDHETGKYRHMF